MITEIRSLGPCSYPLRLLSQWNTVHTVYSQLFLASVLFLFCLFSKPVIVTWCRHTVIWCCWVRWRWQIVWLCVRLKRFEFSQRRQDVARRRWCFDAAAAAARLTQITTATDDSISETWIQLGTTSSMQDDKRPSAAAVSRDAIVVRYKHTKHVTGYLEHKTHWAPSLKFCIPLDGPIFCSYQKFKWPQILIQIIEILWEILSFRLP